MNKVFSNSRLFIKRNASTILTCLGGAGVIGTVVLAIKATPKAMELLRDAKEEKGEDLTVTEVIVTSAPVYIPTVVVGASTIACIFSANALNKRQQAALTSAYALLNSTYKDYRNKAIELYGEEADVDIRNEVAKDHYEEDDIIDGGGTELFYDEFSKRYFKSTIYKVQHAEYQINRDLVMMECARLNDFYDYLGIPGIEGGDEIGWARDLNFQTYWQTWVDFTHPKLPMANGVECRKLVIFNEPIVGFEDYS